jgi:hypothetical protein
MPTTAKSYQIGKAPRKITLHGDRTKPESAQHIIEFPGGAIELSRLADGSYWMHIIVNRAEGVADVPGLQHCTAEIVDSRIDYEYPANPNIIPIPNASAVQQIAVRVRAVR